MEDYILQAKNYINQIIPIVEKHLTSFVTFSQAAIIVSAIIIGFVLSRSPITKLNDLVNNGEASTWIKYISNALISTITAVFILITMLIGQIILESLFPKSPLTFISITINLTLAWAVIRFVAYFINNQTIARWFTFAVWGIVALNITGLLEPTLSTLDSIGFTAGEKEITALSIIKAGLSLFIVLWLANRLSSLTERKLRSATSLTPSIQVLLGKIVRIALISIAILVSLKAVGIDLTAFAVFSGAVGVGLGFGLQKVVSNFISGIILLTDRSIKPGDVIRVDDTYGWVNSLNARSVSVITRDGKEHLIPNELLITEKVENWSYSANDIRIKVPFGISYDADPNIVIELAQEVAKNNPRVMSKYEPLCLLTNFGDNAVELELRAWINDPAHGISNLKSELLLGIWNALKENNINIPYPQRDLHLKTISKEVAKAVKK